MHLAKWIGFFCVIIGCSGLGVWYSMQFHSRISHIKEMLRILNLIISEIQYGQSTLPECYRKVAEKAAEPYREVFRKMLHKNRKEDGSSMVENSRQMLTEVLRKLPLREEKDIFIKCFTDVGFEDAWMQLKILERGKTDLLNLLETEEKELKTKSKLAISLGAMGGVLLVLILI